LGKHLDCCCGWFEMTGCWQIFSDTRHGTAKSAGFQEISIENMAELFNSHSWMTIFLCLIRNAMKRNSLWKKLKASEFSQWNVWLTHSNFWTITAVKHPVALIHYLFHTIYFCLQCNWKVTGSHPNEVDFFKFT
jgi:hypothetical protein